MPLHPKDLVGNALQSTFGCVEFEQIAVKIVEYLADDTRHPDPGLAGMTWPSLDPKREGWEKCFRLEDLRLDGACSTALVVAFGIAGWLDHVWFPKGVFKVSDIFVKRLEESFQKRFTT